MKKLLVMLSVVLVSVFALAELKDVPTNHWAYDSVVMLEKAGVITGYPDGTFKGTNNVTRYELAVFLARIMKLLEEDIQKLSVTVDVHENDISALYDIVGQLKKSVALMAKSEDVEALSKRVDVLDKDIIRIYESLTTKASKEDVEQMLNGSLESVNGQIEFLYKKITLSDENGKKYTDEKINELEGKVLNIETNVNDAIPMLRNLVYQNSENIKNLESKLIRYINVKIKSVDSKLKALDEVKQMAEFNTDTLNGFAAKLGEVEYALRKQIEETNKVVEANSKEIEGLKTNVEEIKASVNEKASKTEVEDLSKKVNSVNTMSIIGLITGLVGLGLAIYAVFKP
ncbi:outer membrane protein, putative [Thermosipho africanus TCF52B]|uniref:Outer membrane protein, putative n=1 Tax=Thermosipho africanus (strain TCF52B) TaxID=484019 RepID=B7IFN6_THEAB|nr:S-layer homology domain-containing protein [Thermosipho africanus]ACJ74900.1 outer membrane protein, putative [Thermosipho africanus TCF52B]